jgi:threonine dehydratase
MDVTAILDAMFAVAKAAAPIVAGEKGVEAVALAERVIEMIDTTREVVPATSGGSIEAQLDELVAERDALEKRVNEHVDQTAKRLRGGR